MQGGEGPRGEGVFLEAGGRGRSERVQESRAGRGHGPRGRGDARIRG